MSARPHVLLFDPYSGGHHGQYVAQLVRYWGEHRLSGRLDIAVPEGFLELHSDAALLARSYPASDIRHASLGPPLPAARSGLGLLRHDLAHGRLLRGLLERLRPDHCVLLYVDHLLLSLALDLGFGFPLELSGIYFRPSFHYPLLDERSRRPLEWVRDARKRVQLAAALRNRHLQTLFCLDPYVVPLLTGHRRVRPVFLPDGIDPPAAAQEPPAVRERLRIGPGRQLMPLVGSLSGRKGVGPLLDALGLLPVAAQRKISVLLAGRIPAQERSRLLASARALQESTEVELLVEDRFLATAELDAILAAADLVLAPYQRHVGSSGILVRAAAAGVPVLGSDYGLVGALIRRRRLGLAVDSTRPAELAAALERHLASPGGGGFEPLEALRFAAEHTAERFAATIFEHARRQAGARGGGVRQPAASPTASRRTSRS